TTTEGNIVSVIILDQVNLELGNDTTICTGAAVTLNAGNSGMNYGWSTGEITQTISATATGTYSVTVTNGSCSATDSVHITVLANATINLGTDTTLCAGQNITIDAGNAGLNFVWSTGATAQTITVNASGIYSVLVSNGTCTGSDSINVTVLPAVMVDLGNDTTVTLCTGSFTLDAGNSGMNYVWSTGAFTQTITVSASGTYSVDVINSGGCVTTDTINVTVNQGTISVNLGNDTTIYTCVNDSFLLNAGATGSAYVWSSGQTAQTIFVSVTGTYYVNVTDSIGCSASDTVTITISNNTINFNMGPDMAVCGCIALNAYISGGTFYQWCNGSTYPIINACSTGMYCVTVGNGTCMASDTIQITVNQPPVIDLGNDTTVTGNVILDAGNTGASFLWSTGATSQTIAVNASGQYYVTVSDLSGCTSSDTVNVTVIIGVAETAKANLQASVYPNPSNSSSFTLTFDTAEKGNVEIRIMNTLGLVVYSEKLEDFSGVYNKKINLENFAAGIYFADILRGDVRNAIKISLK
ncbi:MAG: T9SS type A sorting domain-containing protein, partial [Bacteroidia bacterium]|nr:T9SS type A sorting domain-containing protein [Bacteroidia bacterium]